jgi:hypothetical protein
MEPTASGPSAFWDSTFTENQRWAERICDLLIQQGIRMSWHCQSRIECVNLGLVKKCAQRDARSSSQALTAATKISSHSRKTDSPRKKRAKAPGCFAMPCAATPRQLRHRARLNDFSNELERDFGAKCGFYMMVPFRHRVQGL